MTKKHLVEIIKRVIVEETSSNIPEPALKWLQSNKNSNYRRIGYLDSADMKGYNEFARRTQKHYPGLTGEMIFDLINQNILTPKRFNNAKGSTDLGLWIVSFKKIPD